MAGNSWWPWSVLSFFEGITDIKHFKLPRSQKKNGPLRFKQRCTRPGHNAGTLSWKSSRLSLHRVAVLPRVHRPAGFPASGKGIARQGPSLP